MKNRDVTALQKGLGLVGHFLGPRFVNAVSKNKIRIKHYLKARDEKANSLEGVDMKRYNQISEEMEELRIPIAETWAVKDEEGKPVMKQRPSPRPGFPPLQYYDIGDQEGFNKECEETFGDLRKELQKMDEVKMKFLQDWNEEEATITLHMAKEEFLPEEITVDQSEGIAWMIEEYRLELEQEISSEEIEKETSNSSQEKEETK